MLTEYRKNTYHLMLAALSQYPFLVRYEGLARAFKADEVLPETNHIFHGGMYSRQVSLKADSLIFGKRHKLPCFFMLMSGTIFIDSEEFTGEITAPFIINSREGSARWGYTLTDCVVVNVFVTSVTSHEEFDSLYSEDVI